MNERTDSTGVARTATAEASRRLAMPGLPDGVVNVVTGLGAAFLAVFSYLFVLTGSTIFCGISVSAVITSFGGPETSCVP